MDEYTPIVIGIEQIYADSDSQNEPKYEKIVFQTSGDVPPPPHQNESFFNQKSVLRLPLVPGGAPALGPGGAPPLGPDWASSLGSRGAPHLGPDGVPPLGPRRAPALGLQGRIQISADNHCGKITFC